MLPTTKQRLVTRAVLSVSVLTLGLLATGFVVDRPSRGAIPGNGCTINPYHTGNADTSKPPEATEYVRSCDWGGDPSTNCGEARRDVYPDLDGGPTDKAYYYYSVHRGGAFVNASTPCTG